MCSFKNVVYVNNSLLLISVHILGKSSNSNKYNTLSRTAGTAFCCLQKVLQSRGGFLKEIHSGLYFMKNIACFCSLKIQLFLILFFELNNC